MDIFSWNSFVALNWPVKPNGDADSSVVIGSASNGDNKTVWEDWIATADIFNLPSGQTPTWGERYVPKACLDNPDYKAGMKVLDQAAKSDDFFEQAFDSGALIDQAKNFVRYEILINQDMFKTIKDKNWYTPEGQDAAAGDFNFTCGDNDTGEEGAIMIKAAWKLLSSLDDPTRYHVDDAMVFTPKKYSSTGADICIHQPIGLVGLHIVHKTIKQPQWIWSSFEHVDNVPNCENQNTFFTNPEALNTPTCPSELTGTYSFNSASCASGGGDCTACNKKPDSNGPDSSFFVDQPGQSAQLCRENALETSAPPVNQGYIDLLKGVNENSVWANYFLIGTQWNTNIETTCGNNTTAVMTDILPQYKILNAHQKGVPLPLANSTMETYEQKDSNCIDCHSGATNHDGKLKSDFVWFLSQELK